MKNLENYGVVSLDSKEMNETEGGSFWGYVVGYILIEALLNQQAHIDAFNEGREMAK